VYRAQPDFLHLSGATINTFGPNRLKRSENFHNNVLSFQKPCTYGVNFCETLVVLWFGLRMSISCEKSTAGEGLAVTSGVTAFPLQLVRTPAGHRFQKCKHPDFPRVHLANIRFQKSSC